MNEAKIFTMKKRNLFYLLLTTVWFQLHAAVRSEVDVNLFDLRSIVGDRVNKRPSIEECENKYILITTLFNETNLERIKEYIYVLEKNLAHPLIERVHVIYDTSADTNQTILFDYMRSRYIKLDYVVGRPTYNFCFALANKLYPGRRIILANGDIYFNETLGFLEHTDFTNKLFALTRWNLKKDGSLELFRQYKRDGTFVKRDSESSQDAWIFEAPMRRLDDDGVVIQMGTLHCDSRLAFYAHKTGITLLNPCFDIQACHVHFTAVRHYEHTTMLSKLYQEVIWSIPWKRLE